MEIPKFTDARNAASAFVLVGAALTPGISHAQNIDTRLSQASQANTLAIGCNIYDEPLLHAVDIIGASVEQARQAELEERFGEFRGLLDYLLPEEFKKINSDLLDNDLSQLAASQDLNRRFYVDDRLGEDGSIRYFLTYPYTSDNSNPCTMIRVVDQRQGQEKHRDLDNAITYDIGAVTSEKKIINPNAITQSANPLTIEQQHALVQSMLPADVVWDPGRGNTGNEAKGFVSASGVTDKNEFWVVDSKNNGNGTVGLSARIEYDFATSSGTAAAAR